MKQEKQEFKVHLDSKFKGHMGYMRPDPNTKTKRSCLLWEKGLEKYRAERESRDQEPRKGEHVQGQGDSMVKQQGAVYTASLFGMPIFRK